MQKKLLSLVALAAMVVASNVSCNQKNVPIMSDVQHAENQKKYEELGAQINALEEEADAKRKEKDEIENNLHGYEQRNKFRNKLVAELSGEESAINNYKTTSDRDSDARDQQMKKIDNGIGTTFFGYLTEPLEASRSGKEYKRIAMRISGQKNNNKHLADEHARYMHTVQTYILPELNATLNSKYDTMNNLIKSFKQCDRYQESEYDKCLDDEGITMRQRSKDFPSRFVGRAYRVAYENALQHNIPITEEEITKCALVNAITKDSAIKVGSKQEELQRALAREEQPLEHLEQKEKPLILLDDPKEDQGNQGDLSQ